MQTITQLKEYADKYITADVLRKTGLTASILFVVIVAQLLMGAVVNVIDSIPIVDGILELIGLYALVIFTKDNLLTVDQRNELISKVNNVINEVTSDD